MNRSILILSILFFSIAQTYCQKFQNVRITEPEFSETAVFVNDSIGCGILLEQQTAVSSKIKYMTTQLVLEFKMCCSTVSVDSLNSQFIVRVSDNSINPYDLISIVKMKSENSKRTWNTSKSEKIEFKASKYGANSYLITVPRFTQGQYGICFKNSNSVNLCGVKPINL
jgi:hypothetical protein